MGALEATGFLAAALEAAILVAAVLDAADFVAAALVVAALVAALVAAAFAATLALAGLGEAALGSAAFEEAALRDDALPRGFEGPATGSFAISPSRFDAPVSTSRQKSDMSWFKVSSCGMGEIGDGERRRDGARGGEW